MAKIVYGVSGEGSGHSSRAEVVVAYLESQGYTVKIISYDRGYRNLKDRFDVTETEGLHIASADNKVDIIGTFQENITRLPQGFEKGRLIRHELFKDFKPDLVITDFEPLSAYFANHYDLPLITIDNQHRLRYMKYDCQPEFIADKEMTKTIIRSMVPRPDVSLVTTFYYGESKNDRTFFFPPIIREDVRAITPSTGNHILVYLTSGFETFLDIIGSFTRETFIVYGYDRHETVGNIQFKPFSKEGFTADFSSAKGIMATAGFTLLTESLYLKKPYFAMPMKGQFEQEVNGIFLEKLNYGKNCRDVSREAIASFLYFIPEYQETLKNYRTEDCSALFAKLDELLANECALAKKFHEQRKSIL